MKSIMFRQDTYTNRLEARALDQSGPWRAPFELVFLRLRSRVPLDTPGVRPVGAFADSDSEIDQKKDI